MIPEPSAPNIALIGFMATGKTRVGKELGIRTGLPFHDVDLEVEQAVGLEVAEIFARRGESFFREIEGEIFRRLCEGAGRILGCGGGTLIDPRNREILRSRCIAVWLKASPSEILRRIELPGAPARPLVGGGEPAVIVPRLLEARAPLYAAADLSIDTDGRSVEDVAEEIRVRLALPARAAG